MFYGGFDEINICRYLFSVGKRSGKTNIFIIGTEIIPALKISNTYIEDDSFYSSIYKI